MSQNEPSEKHKKTLENAVFKAFSRVFALVEVTGFEPVLNTDISAFTAF